MPRNTYSAIIEGPVNLRYVLDSLDFSDEDVVEAAKKQPKLFLEAARFRVRKMRERVGAEAKYKTLQASKGAKYRKSLAESGARVTEGQISERVTANAEVKRALEGFQEAQEVEEFSKLLLEAYRMRRDSAKVVAELLGAEIYISKLGFGQSTEMDKMRKRLEDKYPGEGKAKSQSRRK